MWKVLCWPATEQWNKHIFDKSGLLDIYSFFCLVSFVVRRLFTFHLDAIFHIFVFSCRVYSSCIYLLMDLYFHYLCPMLFSSTSFFFRSLFQFSSKKKIIQTKICGWKMEDETYPDEKIFYLVCRSCLENVNKVWIKKFDWRESAFMARWKAVWWNFLIFQSILSSLESIAMLFSPNQPLKASG